MKSNIVAGVIAQMLFIACGTTAAAQQVVKIGYAGPMTGPVSQIGKDGESGVKLAIEEANSSSVRIGGQSVRFELESQDDMGDPKTATSVAQKLVDSGAVGVIGHLNSGATLPASKIYSDAGMPEISPASTNSQYTRQGFQTAYRVIGDDHDVVRVLVAYVLENMHAKRIAVVDDRSAYGQSFADDVVEQLKAKNLTPVDRQYVTTQTIDFRGILTALKSHNPDVLIYAGVDAQAGPMRRQMVGLGMGKTLIAGCAIETDKFVELAGGPANAAGNISSESGFALDAMPKGKEFTTKFAKYGKPVLYSPYAYDATWALIKAMQAANSVRRSDIQAALREVSFDGVTGQISFDDKGDLRIARVTIFKVIDGHWKGVESVAVSK
ncbi:MULTISPECIES: branched-chain amino acid ABC transporter substrate-binding protein [Paraburkholderia]|uniref:branched-chain amino acid ABC transporter substrate-binding protein n=1 Tax=Paraburkholderia TaxID=1822464 RepID=UPI00225A27BA|nr:MULTISPECIES: branched-chain amino acid ABC transporter substrate-binding protein [Paraburkholderia]MCX4156676.1 branched-chain amino acid ABC transporter substrate-binding protein [Paraburkholderia aspalathi]MDN7166081.1 branched-chain amino acid ABC transporter substrate-binding protein [Paraburkholderia sp. SECH2]MDQ6394567.1 branched-chain amino acid ABC transporter substrate-binding protein [Paraburkholderia aspalathi]